MPIGRPVFERHVSPNTETNYSTLALNKDHLVPSIRLKTPFSPEDRRIIAELLDLAHQHCIENRTECHLSGLPGVASVWSRWASMARKYRKALLDAVPASKGESAHADEV
jgi:hypothetical protein